VKLFAFDFDNTITSLHVYNAGVAARDVPARWRGDVPSPEELAAVLTAVAGSGRRWCVVTFGQPPVVAAYLKEMGFADATVLSPLSGGQV